MKMNLLSTGSPRVLLDSPVSGEGGFSFHKRG